MFRIGQKVKIYTSVGYIVGMEIDPLEENEVNWEANNGIIYTVRRYAKFLADGYNDFHCCESDITPIIESNITNS